MMSMHDVRTAFINAGNGQLQLTGAILHYTAVNAAKQPVEHGLKDHQILWFEGVHLPSGKTFTAKSSPISPRGDLGFAAMKVAMDVLVKYEKQ